MIDKSCRSPMRRKAHVLRALVATSTATLLVLTTLGYSANAAPPARTPVADASARQGVYSVSIQMPPRLQWNENYGYCGETAMISAGLYYGQYVSQYDARAIASNSKPQYKASSQLLLGMNDTAAAKAMHLTFTEWTPGNGATASGFLAWVKGELVKGHPVAIGVYTNEYRFNGSTNPTAGDPDYDHIVVVTGVTSHHPLTQPAIYYPDDEITLSDNGLWTGTPSGQPQYAFTYSFAAFQANRRQANSTTGNIYSLADANPDYGIAITGVADSSRETLPVRVFTSANYESPEIKDGSNTRPKPMPLTLTATVSDLRPGTTYNLYRYDSAKDVPTSDFNAGRSAAAQSWTFTATAQTYTINQNITSNDEVLYRAVPASES